MKSLLSIVIASFLAAPALFAGDNKASATKSKDACCEETKATACASACSSSAKSCEKEVAIRKALLTHKGGQLLAKR